MPESSDLEPFKRLLADKKLGFPDKPQVVRDLQFFAMPDGLGLQVRGLVKSILLRGRLAETLVPWLLSICDGKRTLAEIVSAAPDGVCAQDVADALFLLFKKGVIGVSHAHIAPDNDESMRRQLLFWGRQIGMTRNNESAEQVAVKLMQSRLLFIGNGLYGTCVYDMLCRCGFNDFVVLEWGPDDFLSKTLASWTPQSTVLKLGSSLEQVRLALNEYLPEVDLLVLAVRNCGSAFFQQINQLCLSHYRRWLCSHDRAGTIDIGPFVEPYSSACWTCMHLRQVSAMEDAISEALYDEEITKNPPLDVLVGESITMATMAASMIAEEAIRIITVSRMPVFVDAVSTVANSGSFKTNRFRRVPRCPDCYRGKHERILKDSETFSDV